LVLASFKGDADAARQALSCVRYYHFTEKRCVGRPTCLFSYFLVNGLAPRGLPFGVPSAPLAPETLQVRQVNGRWALCQGETPVISLGNRREEAADLLDVIRRQHLDLLCRVGKEDAGFTFIVRTR
jgi:hypothetical protein